MTPEHRHTHWWELTPSSKPESYMAHCTSPKLFLKNLPSSNHLLILTSHVFSPATWLGVAESSLTLALISNYTLLILHNILPTPVHFHKFTSINHNSVFLVLRYPFFCLITTSFILPIYSAIIYQIKFVFPRYISKQIASWSKILQEYRCLLNNF